MLAKGFDIEAEPTIQSTSTCLKTSLGRKNTQQLAGKHAPVLARSTMNGMAFRH